MNRALTGRYVPGTGALHRLHPTMKLCCFFLLAAAVGFSVYQPVFNKGMDMLTSATACIVIVTAPVITGVFARISRPFGSKK